MRGREFLQMVRRGMVHSEPMLTQGSLHVSQYVGDSGGGIAMISEYISRDHRAA